MKITKSDIDKAEKQVATWKGKLEKYKDRGVRIANQLVGSVETNGSAFIMGLVSGRTGGVEVFGAPLEVVGGLVLDTAGVVATMLDSPIGEHLSNVGDGMTAGWCYMTGLEAGTKWAAKAEKAEQKQLPAGTAAAPAASTGP